MQTSLSHLAYLSLEQAIVTLALAPGALVTERQMIEIAGQGRTPVREAVQRLAWQRLMIVRPRVGLQIAAIGPQDYADVMAVRRNLEPVAARLAAVHASPEQRLDLADCASRMRRSAETCDVLGFLAADKAFDEVVEEACPNAFITSALSMVQSHGRRLWYSGADHSRMALSATLHLDVIGAIEQGKAAEAEAATARLMAHLSKESF